MDSKARMLKTWNFEEPDRVPVEVYLYPPAKDLPGADEIRDFQENEADNFCGVPGFNWGFLGLESEYFEEVIEDVPGDFKRIKRTQSTAAGDFTAIVRFNYDDADVNDCHWEKRYIETLSDFRRVAEHKRTVRPFDVDAYNAGCINVGNRGIPSTGLFHPLGRLVRSSNMREAYMWLLTEDELIRSYLESCNTQTAESVIALADLELEDPPVFMTYALEMLTPPWLGKYHFERLVFPYDKMVNDAIHKVGGRHRAHCHGNSGEYLELFADMGIDAVEPLEPSPYGDNILSDAKKLVGNRMLLSGNVVSQTFYFDNVGREEVRELVKSAISVGAPGGGFSLKTTGGAVGNGKTREQCIKNIECGLAFIEAARELCPY
jgi:hypothetical protein